MLMKFPIDYDVNKLKKYKVLIKKYNLVQYQL